MLNNPLKYTDPSGESYEDYGSEYNHGGNDNMPQGAMAGTMDGLILSPTLQRMLMARAKEQGFMIDDGRSNFVMYYGENGQRIGGLGYKKDNGDVHLTDGSYVSNGRLYFNTFEKPVGEEEWQFEKTLGFYKLEDGDIDVYASLNTVSVAVNSAQSGGNIIYQRMYETDQSTIGQFHIEGTDIKGYFMEPSGPSTTVPNQNKRIPAGTYDLQWHSGDKYKNVLKLSNSQVPVERAILIHNGSYPKNTQGCLLCGYNNPAPNFINGSVNMLNTIRDYYGTNGLNGVQIIIYDIVNP